MQLSRITAAYQIRVTQLCLECQQDWVIYFAGITQGEGFCITITFTVSAWGGSASKTLTQIVRTLISLPLSLRLFCCITMNYLSIIQCSATVRDAHYRYILKLSCVGSTYLYKGIPLYLYLCAHFWESETLYHQNESRVKKYGFTLCKIKRFGTNCLKVRRRPSLNFLPLS